WRNTSIAALAPGQVATLPTGTLGYEWDEDLDNGSRPSGIVRLSSTTVSVSTQYLLDYGSVYGAGTPTHRMTLYKFGSALVFGAGTIQWSWGLDPTHDGAGVAADVRMQQATANLLADMHVQAATLQAGLVTPSASTDTTAPVSQITAPADGANLPPGTPVTVTGTATDSGGGVVAGVEVSVDAGRTWHPATGRESWTYSFTPNANGSVVNVKSRAVDDSANLETPTSGVSVTVGSCGACRSSLVLNGSSAYAEAAHAAELNTLGDWTVETWFKDETPGGYNHDSKYILIKGDTNQNGEAPYLLGISYNQLFAGQRTGWTNYILNFSIANLSSGWHHAAVTYVGSTRRLTLYLDGVQVAQVTASNATTRANMLPVEIGRNGSTGMFWQGKLDDIRIWNLARSAGEIAANFRAELANAPAGLVSNWRFNEGSGSVAADSIGLVQFHPATVLGGAGFSADIGNTPPAPDTTPPVISAVAASGITTTGATIGWTTDESSDTRIDYGLSNAYGQSTALNTALVTAHSQQLSGLTASTTYHYRVRSTDAAGNPAISGDFTFTTAAPDTTPPVISAISSSGVTTTTATIGWTTDELSDSQVEYGTTIAYGTSATQDSALVTGHSQQLSGLSP
ncbi:MAG TPA: LamG-like jellyroll fold domain-containing protein, partial [Acidimicrobiia bacterium]